MYICVWERGREFTCCSRAWKNTLISIKKLTWENLWHCCNSCALETLSTLKFAQRAKFIRNNVRVASIYLFSASNSCKKVWIKYYTYFRPLLMRMLQEMWWHCVCRFSNWRSVLVETFLFTGWDLGFCYIVFGLQCYTARSKPVEASKHRKWRHGTLTRRDDDYWWRTDKYW